MSRFLLILLLLGITIRTQAQVPLTDYFPIALNQKEGVKIVTVYETSIADPVQQAGHGNRIRLSRDMVRQMYFDQEGLSYRKLRYINGGASFSTEILQTYNQQKKLISETQNQYNTNIADSTMLIQTTSRSFQYDQQQLCRVIQSGLQDANAFQAIDSISLVRDQAGKLKTELVYSMSSKPELQLQKEYIYQANGISVISKVGNAILNRDEYLLDNKGRILKELNYGPNDDHPRLETIYSYDPRGWLEGLSYTPDWQHFTKAQTVVSRKNKYDDHGKLVEAQLDYGDGKRVLEFYDYTYWVEN